MTTAKRFGDLEVGQRAKGLAVKNENLSVSILTADDRPPSAVCGTMDVEMVCTEFKRLLGSRLTNLVYSYSTDGVFARDFGLRDQMRRAAEGFDSQTQAMFIRYLGIAKESAGEPRAQLYIARDRGDVSGEDFSEMFSLAESWRKPLARRIREDGAEYHVER